MARKCNKCLSGIAILPVLVLVIFIVLAKWLYSKYNVEHFHDDMERELVPMILPGENLIEYKQRLILHQNSRSDGRPPIFDGEYIRDKLDNSRVIKPLDQRVLFNEL